MTAPDDTDSDDAALAAEFALHLLDAPERAAFERRLAVEPTLQRLVREWDEQFAALAIEVSEVRPPRKAKKAIVARLQGPASADPPLWMRWRLGIGGALLALLLGFAVLFGDFYAPVPTGPQFTAELAAEDRSLVVLASLDTGTGTLLVEPVTGRAPLGRVLELWLIAKDAAAPVSLGVVDDASATTISIPVALRDRFAEGLLAISDEPPGGSATGAPTGSVLATGQVTLL